MTPHRPSQRRRWWLVALAGVAALGGASILVVPSSPPAAPEEVDTLAVPDAPVRERPHEGNRVGAPHRRPTAVPATPVEENKPPPLWEGSLSDRRAHVDVWQKMSDLLSPDPVPAPDGWDPSVAEADLRRMIASCDCEDRVVKIDCYEFPCALVLDAPRPDPEGGGALKFGGSGSPGGWCFRTCIAGPGTFHSFQPLPHQLPKPCRGGFEHSLAYLPVVTSDAEEEHLVRLLDREFNAATKGMSARRGVELWNALDCPDRE